jgi:8-oxo-dGTP pyrophosphatase MutT (NUDIX family)
VKEIEQTLGCGPDSDEERWTTSVSVAIIIRCGHLRDRLLLVQRRNGEWGLPAGRIGEGELLLESAFREFFEETSLDEKGVAFLGKRPSVIGIPGKDKTRIGVIFEAKYGGRRLDLDGWPVDDPDGDIVFVKPHDKEELMSLIDHPERINRPEFNRNLMIEFLLSFVADVRVMPYGELISYKMGNPPQYLINWFLKKCLDNEIPGLSIKEDRLFGELRFIYEPPYEIRIP